MNRLLFVGRIDPGSEARIAEILTESDARQLPAIAGARHRSLYRLQDVLVHLVETEAADPAIVRATPGHPLLADAGRQLSEYVSPYLPSLPAPSDAVAACFYRWDAPVAVPR